MYLVGSGGASSRVANGAARAKGNKAKARNECMVEQYGVTRVENEGIMKLRIAKAEKVERILFSFS